MSSKNLYMRIVMECEVIGASIRGKWPRHPPFDPEV